MRPGTGKWVGWCGALIFGLSGAVDGTFANEKAVEPSNEVLAQLFADLATGREFERRARTLRWQRPRPLRRRKPGAE